MKIDMSPKAVDTRIKRVAQLRNLCLELGKCKPCEPGAKNPSGIQQKPAKSDRKEK